MTDQPLRRRDDLVTTDTGDDLLVYDPESHALHTLNAVTAEVFRQVNGASTIVDLVRNTGLTENQVHLALELLREAGLVEGYTLVERLATTSRRRLLRKAGVAMSVPTIASVTMPMASAAASVTCDPSGIPCVFGNPGACCSRTCIRSASGPVCA